MVYKIPVEKPLAVCAVFIVSVMVGYICFVRLPITLMPDISLPRLTVTTEFEGASPRDVETLVTSPLEKNVGTVDGLQKITSTSRKDQSTIQLYFQADRNMDYAAADVREKIDLVRSNLPKEVSTPVVKKFNPSDFPVANVVLYGSENISELEDYVDRLKTELSRLEGVGEVSVQGLPEREVLVEVDKTQLIAYNISLLDITEQLSRANTSFKLGTLNEAGKRFLVRGLGRFKEPKDILKISVARKEKENIPLDKLASVEPIKYKKEVITHYQGDRCVVFRIHKKGKSNLINITDKISKRLISFKDLYLPESLKLDLINKQAEFINKALSGVEYAVIAGSFLAFLVILLFLGNFRNSIIICSAIPVSVFSTFSLLYVSGFSLNLMSLGGLALGAGMLIDNSIVVLESINRHYENSDKSNYKIPVKEGIKEVAGAITASTLTTIAVFFPVIFMQSFASRFFRIIALVIAFSLFVSLLVALFLIPALVTIFLRTLHRFSSFQLQEKTQTISGKLARGILRFCFYAIYPPYFVVTNLVSYLGRWMEKIVQKLSLVLEKLIQGLWNFKAVTSFLIVLLLLSSGFYLYTNITAKLFPDIDSSEFIITLEFPMGSSLESVDSNVPLIRDILSGQASLNNYLLITGQRKYENEDVLENKLMIQGTLQSARERKRDVNVILTELIRKFEDKLPVTGSYELAFGDFSEQLISLPHPLEVKLHGYSLEVLDKVSGELVKEIQTISQLSNVRSDFEKKQPEFKVDINKQKAALNGLTVQKIARTANTALSGYVPTVLKTQGEEIDIRVKLAGAKNPSLDLLKNIPLKSPFGETIRLKRVVDIEQKPTVRAIKHEESLRTVTITANILSTKAHEVYKNAKKQLENFPLPENFYLEVSGLTRKVSQLQQEIIWMVLFSVILIYMTMAGQFDSLLAPFVVMFSVPMAFAGGLAAIYSQASGISLVSSMGFIILAGIVVNNAILIVDLIGQYLRSMPLKEAVIEAAKIRVRPVLMTAFTTILALLPLLFSTGEARNLQRPLVLAIIGGMIVGTFLTLLFIPLLYGVFFSSITKDD